MSTSGKAVVRASGKRGVLTGGKAAVFNADGDCPECCGELCEFCDGATPKTFEVVFSGVTLCSCVAPGGPFDLQLSDPDNHLPGPHTITQVSPCRWSGITTLRYSLYETGHNCDPDYLSDTWIGDATIELTRDHLGWLLRAFFIYHFFYDNLSVDGVASCTDLLVFSNEAVCAVYPYDLGVGGTATVSVP